MGEGAWDVSSPTIPTPNQPLINSFLLPVNVIHNKFLLKRFYVPVNSCFRKKITFDKNGDGVEVQGAYKGKWSIQTMGFRPNPFHKKCSLDVYNVVCTRKKKLHKAQ